MYRLPLLIVCVVIALVVPMPLAQTQSKKIAFMNKVREAEVGARKKISTGLIIKSNVADRLLVNNGARTVRTAMTTASFSTIASPGAPSVNPPRPTLMPNNLVATFYGDWPDTGFCRFTLPARGKQVQQGAPQGCNDAVSHVDVPLNLVVKMCEHDGAGPVIPAFNLPWGQCKEFGAGSQGVGANFNDKATTFWVWDTNENYFYFTSADDEVPGALQFSVTYQGTTDGNGSVKVSIGLDDNWYTKVYEIKLPNWCAHPDIWETTKANDADWTPTIQNGLLRIELRVKPRIPTGPNNWVGVGLRCKP